MLLTLSESQPFLSPTCTLRVLKGGYRGRNGKGGKVNEQELCPSPDLNNPPSTATVQVARLPRYPLHMFHFSNRNLVLRALTLEKF